MGVQLIEILRCSVSDGDFGGLGVEFLKRCGRQMTTRVLEDQIKMALLVGVIEEGKCGAEDKDADGGGKTECGDQEAFA